MVGTEGGGIGFRCRKDSSSGRVQKGWLLVVGAGRTVSSGRYRRGWHWWTVQEGQ